MNTKQDPSSTPDQSSSLGYLGLAGGVLLAGSVITVLAFRQASDGRDLRIQASINSHADRQFTAIGHAVTEGLEEVKTLAAFLTTQERPSRVAFAEFAAPVLEQTKSLHAMEWIPRVFEPTRKYYERAAGQDGLEGFQFKQKGEGGLVTAETRDEYYPVFFVEPLEPNIGALGFDLASNPARKAAMVEADRVGQLTATESINLVQRGGSHPAFLVFAPIYEQSLATESVDSGELRGFALGLFKIDFLIETALRDLITPDLCLVVEDCTSDVPTPLYSLGAFNALDEFNSTKTLKVAGREWVLTCKPKPAYLSAHSTGIGQYAALLIGLPATLLLAILAYIFSKRTLGAQSALRSHAANLEEERARLRSSLALNTFQRKALNAHCIVSETDRAGNITYTNELFTAISGYESSELLGENHRILRSDEHPPSFFKDMWSTISSGHTWHGDVKNWAKDGSSYWVSSTILPSTGSDGRIDKYVSIRSDITEQKRLHEEASVAMDAAETAQDLADEANAAKSEFLANMSHEIRTPMNGIIGMTVLLADSDLTSDQRDQVNTVLSSSEALLGLLNDILDYSKMEAGKLVLETVEFDLGSVVEEAVELLSFRAHEKGLRLPCIIDPNLGRHLIGDPGRLRQVILNLLSNAVKFTDNGEVSVHANRISSTEETTTVELVIKDTGIGMDEETANRIFSAFVQASSATTREYGGTGLGLSITSRLVELMHGTIKVDSAVGQGSIFSCRISFPNGSPIAPMDSEGVSGKRILVACEHASERELINTYLSHWGAEVVEASDIDSALAASEAGFDLTIVDLRGDPSIYDQLRQSNSQGVRLAIADASQRSELSSKLGDSDHLLATPVRRSRLANGVAEALGLTSSLAPTSTPHSAKIQGGNWSAENPPKILLAEDNAVNRMVMEKILARMDCEVHCVTDGLQALTAALDEKYDMVLMDVQMPVMDGYEATRELRSQWTADRGAPIPIIALTANAMKQDREQCMAAGMDDFLTKPIDMVALVSAIERWYKPEPM